MILAISAKPSAMPPKPKMAATKAMIKKIMIKRTIILDFLISCELNYSSTPRSTKDYYLFNNGFVKVS